MNTSIFKKIAKVLGLLLVIGAVCYGGVKVITAIMEKGATPGPQTIEEISGINFDDIARVETSKTINGRYDTNEFIRVFRGNYYEPFSDEISTKKGEVTYRLYDSDNNLIMTLKEYPKDTAIELNVNGEISLHKKYIEPDNASSDIMVK